MIDTLPPAVRPAHSILTGTFVASPEAQTNTRAQELTIYSIVVHGHDEAQNLPELYRRVCGVMERLSQDWEPVLVDDGSRDQSAGAIALLCAQDRRVRGLSLTRNFGFQVAVAAGLDAVRGQAVILMDADLQDPPEVIPQMVQQWRSGFDVVYGVRSEREGETRFKRASAFYRLIRGITNVDIPLDTGDFRLLDRRVVDAIQRMPEHHRLLRGMVNWVGFRQTGVEYKRQARGATRGAGQSHFTLREMMRCALDAITSFSYLPLQLASYFGFAGLLLSGLTLVSFIALNLFGAPAAARAWLSFLPTAALVLFIGAVQLICTGVIGEYLGRMYDEMKGRPLYLVGRRWGFDEQPKR